jgi:hypothetical protein
MHAGLGRRPCINSFMGRAGMRGGFKPTAQTHGSGRNLINGAHDEQEGVLFWRWQEKPICSWGLLKSV